MTVQDSDLESCWESYKIYHFWGLSPVRIAEYKAVFMAGASAVHSPDWVADLLEFSARFGHHVEPVPAIPPDRAANLRIALVSEEAEELRKAILDCDIVGVADACADLIYVTIGTALAFGIDLEPVFAEVHRANLSKSQEKRGDGKTTKGPNFVPPDIAGILARQEPLSLPIPGR